MYHHQHIIAPIHLHNYIYNQLLKEQDSLILLGTNVSTFDQIMNQDIQENTLVEFTHIYKQLQQLSLTHLQNMITYPAFVEELYKMYIEFVKYGISIHDLPTDTVIEKEIKDILTVLEKQSLMIHQKMDHLDTIRDSYQAVIDYASLFEKQILQKQQLPLLSLPWVKDPKISLYKAQNKRQEIESIFQYIIQQQIPIQDVQFIILHPSYYHYIHQMAKRYHIPVSGKAFSVPSLYIQKLVSAISFIQNPDEEHLLAMCNHAFFQCDTTSLVNYLKYQPSSPMNCLQPFTALQTLTNSYFRIEQLQNLEKEAEEVRLQILPILEVLLSDHDSTDKIVSIFDYLLNDTLLNDKQEEQAYYKAKDVLENLLKVDAPLLLIEYELQKIQKSYEEVDSDAIYVSTLDTILPGYPLSIIIGASQDHFPAIKEFSGIIDEQYVSKLNNFPSKSMRANHYYQLAEKLYHVSNEIMISYSCSNLQGKSFELSIEIEKRFGKDALEWPLVQVNHQYHNSHFLDGDLAKSLFLHKNVLMGSVSSLERYQNCRYAYFIERGLKVKELESLDMDHRIMGTLQHAVMEYFVPLNREVSKEELQSYLHPIFESLMPLFPQREDYLITLEKQMVERFTQRLQDIYTSIQGGVMQPSHFEYPIKSTIDVKPYPILLNGIVDRIDTSEEYLRIVDYKSSKKELTDGQFEEGLQLQLITYLIIASEVLHKRPYGAYYQSVKIENTDVTIYGPKDKVTKERLPMNPTILQQQYLEKNAAKGWRMEDINEDSFVQETYFKYKDKNFNELKEILLNKYQEIVSNITSGQIAPNPTENTCKYCPYHTICRYHGETRKISKRKGVKADAKME